MFFVTIFLGLFLGSVVIILIARYSPDAAESRAQAERRQQEHSGIVLLPSIPFDEFREIIVDLLDVMEFRITFEHNHDHRLNMIARTSNPLSHGKFIVHAIHQISGDIVDQTDILQLQDSVKADRAQKGILLTPYQINASGLGNLDVSLELIDGKKLRALVSEHLPHKLESINAYRGF